MLNTQHSANTITYSDSEQVNFEKPEGLPASIKTHTNRVIRQTMLGRSLAEPKRFTIKVHR